MVSLCFGWVSVWELEMGGCSFGMWGFLERIGLGLSFGEGGNCIWES